MTNGGEGTLTVVRNPFHLFGGSDVYVTITNPVEGMVYYLEQGATQNITVNTNSDDCQFKINDNDWNVLDLGGDPTTFPEGENTLTVECTVDGVTASDSIGFEMNFLRASGGMLNKWALTLGVGLLMFIVMDDQKVTT